MPYNFIYEQLSKQGLCDAFGKHFGVQIQNDLLYLDNEKGSVSMQYLNLPGDIEIVFTDYTYHQDILFSNVPTKEQSFALFIDCEQTNLQDYSINNEKVEKEHSELSNAYLMNTVFPYRQLRKGGTTGKSIIIFIPPYLLEGFYADNNESSILGKFYSFQNKGMSIFSLGILEQKIVDSFFYQWEKYKNVLSITKYTYQLLEWYFSKLINFLENNINSHKLSPEQAQDLFLLQSYIQDNLCESSLDLLKIQHTFSTPFSKLKQLFEKVHRQTIHEYFKESKLIRSVKSLLNTEKNIAEIAYEFGYANPSNFSASFKKYYSLGPNDYRLKYKTTKN